VRDAGARVGETREIVIVKPDGMRRGEIRPEQADVLEVADMSPTLGAYSETGKARNTPVPLIAFLIVA
jgi:hypothetical protein